MGQRSTFMLERQGTFQHWKNIWDSKESFQKTNFELLLLKDCMSVFFSNKNYLNWRFFNFRNKKYLSKRFGIKTSSRDLEKYLVEKKKSKKKVQLLLFLVLLLNTMVDFFFLYNTFWRKNLLLIR